MYHHRQTTLCVYAVWNLSLYIHAARAVEILVEILKSPFTFWLYVENTRNSINISLKLYFNVKVKGDLNTSTKISTDRVV